MSINFKIKKDMEKKSSIKNINTLENKYRNKINYFSKQYDQIDKFRKNLQKIELQLEKIDKNRENGIFIEEETIKRAELITTKNNINDQIHQIQQKSEEMKYFDNAGELISEYYNMRETDDTNNNNKKNILNCFEKKKTNSSDNNKAVLFEKYCKVVEGIRINKDDGTNRIIYCSYCGIEKFLDTSKSSYICSKCGDMEYIIIDEDRQIKDYSPYKRINHFKEWLNQFQAKESTDISDEVFKNIVKELNKLRIVDHTKLTRCKMQSILKKLGYNKLYEHIPFIINKLTNLPAPKIDSTVEKKFIFMFTQIQEPWELYKPKGRKNFLSYPYILYKFSELLELDHLLKYFPMLKQNKLMEQDIIWQKFCKHLKWEFYPTT
uniref:VLTF3-like protein n=1 Tax=Megaviridae environmental sample TaxID=1737588 RepID=A0A5J6VKW2_9VIRU|nr:MAG: VLTF3-like protein [Megaviridae environmental sample]